MNLIVYIRELNNYYYYYYAPKPIGKLHEKAIKYLIL